MAKKRNHHKKGPDGKPDYSKEVEYESSPKQVAARVRRNKARAQAEKAGKVRKGDGKDVHHAQPNARGKTRVVSEKSNSTMANKSPARRKRRKK